MEAVFERAERQFSTIDQQIGWLSSFKDKPGNAYEKDAVKVAEQLETAVELTNRAESANSLSVLKSLSSEANNLKFGKDEPLSTINDRIRVLEGEAEEAKQQIREAQQLQERQKAEERLRELQPSALGGIRSGEKRRAPAAARFIFNQ